MKRKKISGEVYQTIPWAKHPPEKYHAALFVRRPELPPLDFDKFDSVLVEGYTHEDAFHAALSEIASRCGYKLVRK